MSDRFHGRSRFHGGVGLALGASLAATVGAADQPRPAAPLVPPAVAGEADPTARAEPLGNSLPIDLPTALRLVDANNPTVALARARLDEAYARQRAADVYYLPNLVAGATYYRLDGRTQNQRGELFTTSRSNLFSGAGVALRFDVADAVFLPLAARRLAEAAAANARAVSNNIQLDVALAYLDLLEVYGRLAINADTLARTQEALRRAEAAATAGLSKTTADVSRIRTEVELRLQERIALEGRVGVASVRLTQLIMLDPTVDLRPADPAVLPITLVPNSPLDTLVEVGLANRPELSANRSVNAAAQERLRQAKADPFVPKVQLDYTGGVFGGGRNDDLSDFSSRGTVGASINWQLRNFGLGNRAEIREREAQLNQTFHRVREVQAQVSAEVAAAAKLSAASLRGLGHAQEAVRQATEMYRRLLESSFGMVGQRGQFDALEPYLAIQALNQARVQYLGAVVEYNRAQFRLYAALGQPPTCALPDATPQPLEVPAMPAAPTILRPPEVPNP
jgi:outer membrane protein TolC